MHSSSLRSFLLTFLGFLLLVLLASVFLLYAPVDRLNQDNATAHSSAPAKYSFDFPVTWATVDGVMDGDTIRLRNGKRVRYIGIDTPETENKPPDCYAKQAKARNRQLVEGQRIALRKDKRETDRYGRLLRYIYLEDGQMVNEMLVAEGFARATPYRPDTRFEDRFAELEQQAKQDNWGLWGECE